MSFQPMNENERERMERRAYRRLRGIRTEIYKFLLSAGVPVGDVVGVAEASLKPLAEAAMQAWATADREK